MKYTYEYNFNNYSNNLFTEEYFTNIYYEILFFLEKKYNKSFINNMNGIKVIYVPLEDKNSIFDGRKYIKTAEYKPRENTLFIYGEGMLNKYYSVDKDEGKYLKSILQTISHEYFHIASTNKNYKNNEYISGFVSLIKRRNQISHTGLNEAITNHLTAKFNNNETIINKYYLVLLLSRQIMSITGEDIVLEAYFNNKGVEHFKHLISSDDLKSNQVLFQLERIYELISLSLNGDNILYELQNNLMNYLFVKLNNDSLTYQEKVLMLDEFESSLITEELLDTLGHKDQFRNINENIEQFISLKDEYLLNLNNDFQK